MTDSTRWFQQKRFGLFIHWGIYSIHGVHEQEEQRFGVPHQEYVKLIDEFNPVKFDPAKWLDAAQAAGMQYLVFTVKHHDGFCLWDTAETEFNIMRTPYGKDTLKMLADECHKRDFPLVLYYSCVDWHHPAYPNIGRHHEIVTDPARHDMIGYMTFVKRQIRELCTKYGKIHGFWWDMNVPGHVDPSVNALIRSLQPGVLINNRGYDNGDFATPERDFQEEARVPFTSLAEACDSIGCNSWGYRQNEDYFAVRTLERKIALYLALGANFLLNVGPDALGELPPEGCQILQKIGEWHRHVGGALRDTPCYGVVTDPGILGTGGGKILNLVILNQLASSTLTLHGFATLPVKAELLNLDLPLQVTATPVIYETGVPDILRLRNLPAEQLYGEIAVIRLTFAEPVIRSKPLPVNQNRDGIVRHG